MRPLLAPLLLLSALGCGRVSPGTIWRPYESNAVPSGPSSSSGTRSRYSDQKPVYDDKGCANMTGEGGAKVQAACRSGR